MDVIKNIATPVINFIKDNKETIKSGVDGVGNIVKMTDSTAMIVKELMKRKEKLNESTAGLQNIVDKINAIKQGSGFAYV